MNTTHERITIDVRLSERSTDDNLEELRRGLTGHPRTLPTHYFYDDLGSHLFERICELPEYYQTRTEHALLETVATEVAELTGAEELVELGSGAATKTRVLLNAFRKVASRNEGHFHRYVPFDVSEGIVRRVAEELIIEYPHLEVHGVIGDFLEHLGEIPYGEPRLVVFLGGTIGNLKPLPQARDFLRELAGEMSSGDCLLLGTDLIKDVTVVERAYNDDAGVTAAFNLNALAVVNRSFDADFDLEHFRHLAFYNSLEHRIEMWLVSTQRQKVRVGDAFSFELTAGEGIRTEISTKYDQPRVETLLNSADFDLVRWYTDPEELFALSLARRR